jgi:predicted DNA-binding transcriptional regulator AlpA
MSDKTKTKTVPNADALLDVPAAAALLNVSRSFMNKARLAGDGPAFLRLGRAVRYSRADLAEWLAKNRRLSTSAEAPRAA